MVVQLRFMKEDHNHQNGIQSCVLPVNQTWKYRFLGKQNQGMVDHDRLVLLRRPLQDSHPCPVRLHIV